jgi:putative membrane protein
MRRTVAWTAVLALGLGLCLARIARAEDKGSDDQKFVTKASAASLAEVNLGRLATQQAVGADVRKFGQSMVDDHSAANKELNKIADSKNFRVAQTMGKKNQEAYDKLAKMSGADFDHAFMKHMLKDHKEAVALFEKESKDGRDADLKAFAAKTLPTLREHLQMAKKLTGTDKEGKEEIGTKRGDRSKSGSKDKDDR